jgi:hypothetical protein
MRGEKKLNGRGWRFLDWNGTYVVASVVFPKAIKGEGE